jgi:predicted short-subunit dehydrogenase-like oxidoreductase (DUF2520 family)
MMPLNDAHADPFAGDLPLGWCDVVGRGRMGRALFHALHEAGVAVRGPHGRGASGDGASIVILCVPDREIASACAMIRGAAIVGHVSASAELALLAPYERFMLHPLLSVVGEGALFAGAACAVDGSTARSLGIAHSLATRLGMRARRIPPEQRALYHAAASAASNYLTTVEGMAERLAKLVGLERADLLPLVRSAVDNWSERGASAALTGPVARGDEETVLKQRAAVSVSAPDQLPLWDALVDATRALARSAAAV